MSDESNHMKRKLIVAVLGLLVVFCTTSTIYALQTVPLTPEQTIAEIKQAAVELVKSGSAVIKKPVFEYNEGTKVLEYYLGGVRPGSLEMQADNPNLLLFENQIRIEALRNLLNQKAPEQKDEYWGPPLALAEQLLTDAARDIQTIDKTKIQEKLEARSQFLSSSFIYLDLSIIRLAKQKGYTAKRVGDRSPASDSFTVNIITSPAGGRVKVLPWMRYIECSRLKQCGDVWPWRELVSETENMIGPYFYHAEWPGGRSNEDRIEVRNNSPLTFRPKE